MTDVRHEAHDGATSTDPNAVAVPAPRAAEPDHHASVEALERGLFASRWLLAPLYVGLVGGLLILLIKFGQAFVELARKTWDSDMNTVTMGVLHLLDITLIASLILIVIFAGYENFVSKIGAAENSKDRPSWMGRVDYSGLKIKVIGSIVAISAIGLLQDFLDPAHADGGLGWQARIAIHMTFLVSGVLFALMDFIADKRTPHV